MEAVHESMPAPASEALTVALADACHDPLGVTEPYGVDDGVMRILVIEEAFAVLLVGPTLKTLTVLQVTYL
ncbi:hypothetical protein ACWDO7_22835 [Streptomyces sp. NPDC003656]